MKIFNLSRGKGKTTRMLYASEFNNIPILCYNEMYKQNLIEMAHWHGINIPNPMTVSEFLKRGQRPTNKILIDEMDSVLSLLMLQAFGTEIVGGTMTIKA